MKPADRRVCFEPSFQAAPCFLQGESQFAVQGGYSIPNARQSGEMLTGSDSGNWRMADPGLRSGASPKRSG
jgi:hypothetical protein